MPVAMPAAALTGWICSRPFDWLEIQRGGSAFLCCPAWLRRSIGNVLHQPLAAVWNSATAIELRKNASNGRFHGCSPCRCPFLARHQPPVMPAAAAPVPLRQALQQRDYRQPLPGQLHLCYDPRCNLACASCRPAPLQLDRAEADGCERLTRLVLDQLAPQVRHLRLSGHGEPFAAPSYRQVLAAIGPQHFPALQSLHLHSNGLLWISQRQQLLPRLRPYLRSVEISIDAASPASYRCNRGADFDQLLDNLAFIHSLHVDLTLSFVVQHNNFREMPAFVDLARRFGARCFFSPLINWGSWTTAEYRQRAVHRPQHPQQGEFMLVLAQISQQTGVDIGVLGQD